MPKVITGDGPLEHLIIGRNYLDTDWVVADSIIDITDMSSTPKSAGQIVIKYGRDPALGRVGQLQQRPKPGWDTGDVLDIHLDEVGIADMIVDPTFIDRAHRLGVGVMLLAELISGSEQLTQPRV